MTVVQLIAKLEQMPKQAHVMLKEESSSPLRYFCAHEVDRVTHYVWRGDFPTKHTVYLEFHN